MGGYGDALKREIGGFGFNVSFEARTGARPTAIESAFLKANTHRQLLVIETDQALLRDLHPTGLLKIKLEVDTNPPGGFQTESRYLMQPVPFPVRVYRLPDLFAGKLHAILCRKWRTRVRGRDWYDLAWYAGQHPQVRLSHLESRMRQSRDYDGPAPLTREILMARLHAAVDALDIDRARLEVVPFLSDAHALDVWSRDFFLQVAERIEVV